MYPTTNAEDVAFIVANSGSRVVVAENQTQVDKLVAHRTELPAVEKVVIIDGAGDGDWVITLDDLEQRGKQLLADTPTAVTERIDAIRPDQLATLIYTSGTTGKPKGVRLNHEAWTYTAAAIDSLDVLSDKDLNYLWLPLAHSFGKVMLALPLMIGFPTVIDGRVDKIVENLAVIRPTIMGAVPRIFEKVHGRITEMIAEEGGAKKRLFDWAIDVGLQVSRAKQAGHRWGRCSHSSTRSQTDWCSTRFASDSVGACGSSSPVRRRWTVMSPSGSMRSGPSSWRATASPRRQRPRR